MDREANENTIDRELWVVSGDFGLGWLVSNAHTYPGRFLVYWQREGGAYSTSLADLDFCSRSARYWLEGFLYGAEPDAWFGDPAFTYDDSDPRTALWHEALAMFHLTGSWKVGRRCAVDNEELLPSEPSGAPILCSRHRSPGDRPVDRLWPTELDEQPHDLR